jgi:hypothetical protein
VRIRHRVGRQIEKTLGPNRARLLRQYEQRGRSRLIQLLDVEGRAADRQRAAQPPPAKQGLTRQQMIDEIGRRTPEGLGSGSKLPPGLSWVSMDPPADYPRSELTGHGVLAAMHERLKPRTYVEIGVHRGKSLTLSRARSIAVDPSYNIVHGLHCDLRTFVLPSDEFFAQDDAFEHFGGTPVDLAFIDGMHLADYVLRDFMNIEKHMSPGGVVILDDMIPRSSLEAYRIRRTGRSWTGDIFKVHEVLRTYRPDLTLLPVNCEATGSYLIVGLDPSSTVLDDAYESVLPQLTSPDPQTVPDAWLRRRECHDPHQVIDSDVWDEVRALRAADAARSAYAPLWERLAGLPTLGDVDSARK